MFGGNPVCPPSQLNTIPPLVLAYLGDSVFEVFVRERLVGSGGRNVNLLHRQSIGYVKAASQAKLVQMMDGQLTEEERNVVRRGRNAHSHTIPKNADVGEYRYATGLEALVGYLYLQGKMERLQTLLEAAFESLEGEAIGGRGTDIRTECGDGVSEGGAAD